MADTQLAKRRGQQLSLAFCWSHVRRKFYDLAASSPVATEILRRIAMLYAIDDEVRGYSAERRRSQRVERSRIIVEGLRLYLDARLRQISAKSKLAEAIRYATTRWDGLVRFIDDGRIELDTNTVERSIRPQRISIVIQVIIAMCWSVMRSKSTGYFFKLIAEAWLSALIHVDAFRAEPWTYLIAVKWLVKRKRVRARGQLAPLFSLSSRAYRLWMLRRDMKGRLSSLPDACRPIIVLIHIRNAYDPKDLAATCKSVAAEGLPALLIGSVETPTLADVVSRISWASRPWLMPISCGDRIAPGAAAAYRTAMGDSTARVLYADDDLLIGCGRTKPYFKPDWNSELFRHSDYLSGACIMRATRYELEAVADAPDWPERLVRRLVREGAPLHVLEMLHHRRHRPTPTLPAKPLVLASDLPPISVIVPTRNRVDLLRTCLDGVAVADYPDVEVVVVDNDSDDPDTLAYLSALDPARYRVLRHVGPFNYSSINNRAVDVARGRLLCLLNNDIEVIDSHWLATLATQALRPDVGAVGARLLYPDGRIQHAGVVIGIGNAAGHAHRFLLPEREGYFHRHSLPQFTMAVTAACLVLERHKFLAAGGLDAQHFAVAFNDVDLCLRLNQRGWQSLYEPRATLVHHESVSRGLDQDPVGLVRFAGELAELKRIWKTDECYDPYHHPQLSRSSEQFAVAI